MKRIFNHLFAVLLTFVLTGCLFSFTAFAEEMDNTKIEDLSGSYVNPMYEQYANKHTMPTFDTDVSTYNNLQCFSSATKAGVYVRDQMELRNNAISFQFLVASGDYSTNLHNALSDVIDEAWKHTGVPTEGDYLHWQIIQYGWSARNGVYMDCDTIRFDVTFEFDYFTTASQETYVDAFADAFVDTYGNLDNNYQKICAIYDYLTTNVTYDYENLYDTTYYLKHSAYAAAVNGTSVCQGYALLFYRLALELDVDVRFIGSIPAEQHCWNIVQISDKYYNLDATWDAGSSYYRWFLLGSDNFYDHTRSSEYTTSAFNKSYPTSTTNFSVDKYVPAPTLKGTIVESTGKPKISWNSISNASKYEVYRATSKTGKYTLLATTENTAATNKSADAGKTYYYKVRAVYTNGLRSEFSNIVKLTTKQAGKLAAPTMSISTNSTSGKPVIKWNAVDGAISYQVAYCTKKDGEYKLLKDTTATSVTHTGAVAGKKYYYKVRAISSDSTNNSIYCSPKYVTCDCARPVVKATNVASTGKIKLTWDAVSGADKYEVYRATSKTGTYSLLTTTSKTTVTNTKTTAGTTYYYKVKALNSNVSAATSAYSAVVSRTCDCAQPVVTLSNVASTGKIKISWKAVDGADKYEVYRATSKTGTYSLLTTTTKTTVTNTSTTAGKSYYYKVRALISGKSAATGACSAVVSRTCDCAQPVVTASNVASTGKIKLTWDAVSGADKYEVYRATSKDGTYSLLTTTSKTTVTNTSTTAGKSYYYKVRALISGKSAATGACSAVVSRTCDLPRPEATIKLNSSGKPTVSWSAVEGADKYEVYRATSKDGTYSLLTTTTKTAVTNTKATAGKTYYYKVKAIDADKSAANSAYSIVVSITSK